ncbi:MAG: hypothetical protein HC898_03710 [Phycisphaerales bacterium]|nr:hypothetical protein [Phycisphaerales bacterium]
MKLPNMVREDITHAKSWGEGLVSENQNHVKVVMQGGHGVTIKIQKCPDELERLRYK